MNKKSKPTIYLAFIALIFFFNCSCKKYPDGPLISLTSKNERLVRTWKMEYLEIGGIDSTSYFLAENDSGLKFEYLKFFEERDASYISYASSNKYRSLSFDWAFMNKKKYLKIDISEGPQVFDFKNHLGPFWVIEKVEFRIMKLTKEELWLETTYNGNLTKAHFKVK